MTDLPSFMSADPAASEDLSDRQPAVPVTQDPPASPSGEAAPAPFEAAPAPADAAAPAGQPPQGPAPPGFVPLATFLDMRDRAKQLEGQIPPPAPTQAPDRFEDPEGYEAWREQQIDNRFAQEAHARFTERLAFSQRLAVKDHGTEKVDAAREWAKGVLPANPGLKQAFQTNLDPVGFIVDEYEKAQRLNAVSDPTDFAAYQAWKATQTPGGQPAPAGSAPPNPAAPAAKPQPTAPPPSIAGAPSAAGPTAAVLQDGEATYQRMFAR